ncbi:hypothetical protein EDD85DRAFT_1006517 [Armillaria nabsnona]|nr:hypothetical protein EDD85DRAFT_1006517 [Armillaria nabsnona]
MHKKMRDMVGLTDDDMKALAPLPDENDPGIFEHEHHPDDDVRTHAQVGDSQCLLTNYLKRRLEHIPGFPRPVKETGAPTTGDLIADERPLMVFPMGPSTDLNVITPITTMTDEKRNNLLNCYSQEMMCSIFERMSEENQATFMRLHNGRLQNGPLLGVARTNGYGLEDALKDETEIANPLSMMSSNNQVLKSMIGRYVAVFKDLSRVNHSCSPNVHRQFHMATFSMQLRAARDIEEGEEIFTYYTQILLPAADRPEGLAPYGIECTCRACLDTAKSDPIRAAVLNYSPPALLTSDARIDAAVQILAKIEEEELQASAPYCDTLYHLFTAYALTRDEKNALMYGEKLWLANLAAGEPLCEMLRNAELLKKSPQWMSAELVAIPERLVSLWNPS